MRVLYYIAIGRNWRLSLIDLSGVKGGVLRRTLAELGSLAFGTLFEAVKWLAIACLVAIIVAFLSARTPAASIPKAADKYRATLVRTSHAVWGLDAPIAVFAGQIHAESRWNPDAKSHAGAAGLAQFMPATAAWLPTVAPETGEPLPYNPGWAIRALVSYDLWLWKRTQADNDYERMAFTLSKYNGGEARLNREIKMAEAKGYNPGRWFGHVERFNAGRSAANKRENQEYPRIILHEFQRLYLAAGWGAGLQEPD